MSTSISENYFGVKLLLKMNTGVGLQVIQIRLNIFNKCFNILKDLGLKNGFFEVDSVKKK